MTDSADPSRTSLSYRDAGVDIETMNESTIEDPDDDDEEDISF